jgi:hypothetical protein
MSKKNKRKYKFTSPIAPVGAPLAAEAAPAASSAAKPTEALSYDMQKEFRNLGLIVLFILALLFGLYLYDQQTHILRTLTSRLFGL